MRIRGLQLRGFTRPAGEHQLDFESGFTSLETRDAAGAHELASLLCSLLYPEDAFHWVDLHTADTGARAVLSLAVGGESYLLVIDAGRQRMNLGRWDAATRGYRPLTSLPAEIAGCFRDFCPLERADFRALHTLGLSGLPALPEEDTLPTEVSELPGQGDEPLAARRRLEIELERAHAACSARSAAAARAGQLRAAREAADAAGREAARASAGVEACAALGELREGLDARIAAFHEALAAREAERHETEKERRGLLTERARLRNAPGRFTVPSLLGTALAVAGAGVAVLVHPAGAGATAVGAGMLGTAWVRARGARRRLGRVEAILGALRLRDRTCEQRFDSETSAVRVAMEALELAEVEELRAAVESWEAGIERAKQLEEAAAEARAAFGAESADELAELEASLAAPDPAARVAELERELGAVLARLAREQPAPAAIPARAPLPAAEPDDLVAAAGRCTGLGEAEVRGRLGGSLPLYLRALTDGRYTHARHRPGEGWLLRGPGSEAEAWASIPATLRESVALAFQLALLERLGDDRRVPLIVGPDAAATPARARVLARVLGRLASVIQVLRVGAPDPAWAAHADRTLRLDA